MTRHALISGLLWTATSLAAPPAMEPLAPLAGHCWEGTFEGSEASDRHCFEWLPGGHFLRDRHTVRTGGEPYHGETIHAVEGDSGQLTYTYYNSLGGISHGTISTGETADSLHAEERHVARDGTVTQYRSSLTFDEDGRGYRVRSERRTDEGWKAVREIHYRRIE